MRWGGGGGGVGLIFLPSGTAATVTAVNTAGPGPRSSTTKCPKGRRLFASPLSRKRFRCCVRVRGWCWWWWLPFSFTFFF